MPAKNTLPLSAEEERFRALTTLAPAGIFEANAAGEYVFVNTRWQALAGLSQAQAAGRGWTEAVHPDDRPTVSAAWEHAVAAGHNFEIDFRFQPTPDRVTWVHVIATACRNAAETLTGYIGSVADVTEDRAAEAALADANERLIVSLAEIEQRHESIVLLNELSSRLQSCFTPEAAAQIIRDYVPWLFPGRSGKVSLTNPAKDMVENVAAWGSPDSLKSLFAVTDCWALRRGKLQVSDDPAAAGQVCQHVGQPAAYLCAPLLAQDETLGVLTLQELAPDAPFSEAERQLAKTVADHLALSLANIRLRETMRIQSMRDALTGLFNRRYMEETLEREVRRASRAGTTLGLIMLDLDHFKHFNDTFGHGAGDALLRALGELLRGQVRGEDVACRYTGDGFVLILPGAPHEVVQQRAETINQHAAQLQVMYAGQRLEVITLSIGWALFPEHSASPAGLLNAADAALYHAKRHGRNQVAAATQDLGG